MLRAMCRSRRAVFHADCAAAGGGDGAAAAGGATQAQRGPSLQQLCHALPAGGCCRHIAGGMPSTIAACNLRRRIPLGSLSPANLGCNCPALLPRRLVWCWCVHSLGHSAQQHCLAHPTHTSPAAARGAGPYGDARAGPTSTAQPAGREPQVSERAVHAGCRLTSWSAEQSFPLSPVVVLGPCHHGSPTAASLAASACDDCPGRPTCSLARLRPWQAGAGRAAALRAGAVAVALDGVSAGGRRLQQCCERP